MIIKSFRDAITRGSEHLSDYFHGEEDSHMLKHLSDEHPDSSPKEIKFGMSVIKQHKTSFDRMIFESVLIYRGGSNILNSKSEFSRCQVPRLSVMVGEGQQNEVDQKTNNEVFKLKRRPKRRRDYDGVETNSSDKEGSGHVNSTSSDSKVLSNSQAVGEILSHNNAKKVKANPEPDLNPPKTKPTFPPKKTKKLDAKVKGQQKISFYFCDTQRELNQNVSCRILPPRPPT